MGRRNPVFWQGEFRGTRRPDHAVERSFIRRELRVPTQGHAGHSRKFDRRQSRPGQAPEKQVLLNRCHSVRPRILHSHRRARVWIRLGGSTAYRHGIDLHPVRLRNLAQDQDQRQGVGGNRCSNRRSCRISVCGDAHGRQERSNIHRLGNHHRRNRVGVRDLDRSWSQICSGYSGCAAGYLRRPGQRPDGFDGKGGAARLYRRDAVEPIDLPHDHHRPVHVCHGRVGFQGGPNYDFIAVDHRH